MLLLVPYVLQMLRWDRSSTDEERLTDGRRDDTRIGASHEQTIVASFLGDVNVRGSLGTGGTMPLPAPPPPGTVNRSSLLV
jgi:hypothetical protein